MVAAGRAGGTQLRAQRHHCRLAVRVVAGAAWALWRKGGDKGLWGGVAAGVAGASQGVAGTRARARSSWALVGGAGVVRLRRVLMREPRRMSCQGWGREAGAMRHSGVGAAMGVAVTGVVGGAGEVGVTVAGERVC